MASDADKLSPLARDLLKAGALSQYRELTVGGGGNAAAKANLSALTERTLLVSPAKDTAAADCAIAALWIWHDYLDQPHEIVQRVHNAIGSYWHGVIHRRERDFSNARYWFVRAEELPISNTIALRADDLLRSLPADKSLFRLTATGWNPSAFVDLVAAVADQPQDPRHALAVSIQQIEWQVLFEHCVRLAGA
jgi:hypothetical protein